MFTNSFAEFIPEIKSLKQISSVEKKSYLKSYLNSNLNSYLNSNLNSYLNSNLNSDNKIDDKKDKKPIYKSKAFAGFNIGTAIIESEVGFAVGAFAEFDADGIYFLPQTNYWKAGDQNNFEIAGVARKYIGNKDVIPYLDGGVGISFYSSDSTDFTKLSILIGGGVELTKISDTFLLLADAKYKLIVSSTEPINISSVILTLGLKFPFR